MRLSLILNCILVGLIFPISDYPELVTIQTLLSQSAHFHKKHVTVRGIVSQPEMHLDETGLFFDFVFVLQEGNQSLVVFGRHDRTQGGSSIVMGDRVQVTGIFWKDRTAHEYHLENNLEAMVVTPYPSLTPDRTQHMTPGQNDQIGRHKTANICSTAAAVPSAGIDSVGSGNLCT